MTAVCMTVIWFHPEALGRFDTCAPSGSPFASLVRSLPPDIEETGWGVPLYEDDVTDRARTPRTSMDKPPSRRGSVDERHAPARKSLDLSIRDKMADPPLR